MTPARLLSAAWLCLLPALASAQSPSTREPLKQGAPPASRALPCIATPTPATPSDQQRQQARDLAQRALQAALLGDSTAARDELREAATLDPTDADLAYRLGRAHQAAGASSEALAEYCRFLALAPNAPESPEVQTRVASLAAARPDPRTAEAEAHFQSAVSAYESGRLADAEAGFDSAIVRAPRWPEPYYNRALTRFALGRRDAAVRDLEQYLRLKPEAPDREAIVARIGVLPRAGFSPGTALAAGLALPGAGHFYTRRPVRGVMTSLAVGTAVAVALMQRTRTSTVEQTGTDPFGNPYTYTTTRRTRERPYAVTGTVVGIGIAVTSAIDAFRYAKRAPR